nr:myosin heavy chain IB-like [Kogia breviceps]
MEFGKRPDPSAVLAEGFIKITQRTSCPFPSRCSFHRPGRVAGRGTVAERGAGTPSGQSSGGLRRLAPGPGRSDSVGGRGAEPARRSLLPGGGGGPVAASHRLPFLREVIFEAECGVSQWGLRSASAREAQLRAEGGGRRVGIPGRRAGSVPRAEAGRGPGLGGPFCLRPGGGAGQGACGGRARREAPAQLRAAPRRSQARCCQVGIQGSAPEVPRRGSRVAASTSLPAGRISVKKPLPPWSPLSPAFLLGNPLLIPAWDLQGPTSAIMSTFPCSFVSTILRKECVPLYTFRPSQAFSLMCL